MDLETGHGKEIALRLPESKATKLLPSVVNFPRSVVRIKQCPLRNPSTGLPCVQ